MTYYRPALLASLVLCAALPSAYAADAVSAADKSFVASVSQGGMFEVELGKLAEDQGSTQAIKDQGNTEAHDHGLVGDKLKSIASDLSLPMPDSLNETFQKELDGAKALSGTAFDATYLKDMEAVHAKDAASFAKESKSGTNPELRAFAAETYRIVLRHIGELKALPAKTD